MSNSDCTGLMGCGVLTLLFVAQPLVSASAQEPADQEFNDIEIVEVTAQKRPERLQDVPISLDVLADQKLDVLSSNGEDILFLAARTPSLYAEASSGRTFPRFYIRGLGNTDFDLNASQPVALVYDDVRSESVV